MKIKYQLILGFLAVASMIFIASYLSITKSKNLIQENIRNSSSILAQNIINDIDRNIFYKIESIESYSKDLTLQKALLNSNQKFEKLNNPETYINNKDIEWMSNKKSQKIFIKKIQNNILSLELIEKINFYHEKYGYKVFSEIFVTNKFGANIAQSNKTSDYKQNDEAWWQNTKKYGMYISNISYDESAKTNSIDICLKINDQSQNFIGILKAVLNIKEITNILKSMKNNTKYNNMNIKLITFNGKTIYSTKKYKLFKKIDPYILEFIKNHKTNKPFTCIHENKKSNIFISHANSKGYKNYKGLKWILLIEQNAKIMFFDIINLKQRLILITLIITLIAILLGLFISNLIVVPIGNLRTKITNLINNTNIIKDIKINNKNEIENLDTYFNQMKKNLEKTTISKDYFNNIIETMPNTLIIIDNTAKIRTINHATTELLGYDKKELIGKPIEIILESNKKFLSLINLTTFYKKGDLKNYELVYKTKTGEKRFMLLSLSILTKINCPLNNAKNTCENFIIKKEHCKIFNGIVCIANDITNLKNAEQKNQQIQLQLQHSEKIAAIGHLAAGIAHEINNPLNFINLNLSNAARYIEKFFTYIIALENIIYNSGIIKDKIKLDNIRKKLKIDFVIYDFIELLKETLDGTQRVQSIVSNLKNFVHEGNKNIQTDCNINTEINLALNLIKNQIKDNISIEKQIEPNIEIIKGFPQKLNQVFLNLLLNAKDAIEDKGKIIIKTFNQNDNIVIEISDTGYGISKKDLRKIFNPFFTTKEVGKGTGLGLSIAYDIIKKHNGKIEVESKIGEGTTFRIFLPI